MADEIMSPVAAVAEFEATIVMGLGLLLLRVQFSFEIILSMTCKIHFDADAHRREQERLVDGVIPSVRRQHSYPVPEAR